MEGGGNVECSPYKSQVVEGGGGNVECSPYKSKVVEGGGGGVMQSVVLIRVR